MIVMIQARYFGPKFAGDEPHQIVIHSVESGIVAGLARALAQGYWQEAGNETSAHNIADPSEAVDMVPDDERAWHCGTGNATSWGKEHTGRAAFTTAQWTTPAGLKMLRLSAVDAARRCRLHSIPPRWLSLTQLANDEKGLCTHNDMRLVRGGTTHTDPGPGFPYDLYLQYVKEELGLAAAGDITYTVRAGDTLSAIAASHGTTVAAIAAANGIADPDTIQVGQVLRMTSKGERDRDPVAVAQARLDELQASAGMDDAEVGHLATAFANIGKADRDPALGDAISRYLDLLPGDARSSDLAYQHIRTAQANLAAAKKGASS